MRRLLLAAVVTLGCATTAPPPPAPTPPPPAPVPSLDEVERSYLPLIEDNDRSVGSVRAKKDEIIAGRLAELDSQRQLRAVLLERVETQKKEARLLAAELESRKKRLAELDPEATGAAAEMRQKLVDEIAELEERMARGAAELRENAERAETAAAEVARLEGVDREGLFLSEVQPLYREGIELHLGFYHRIIDLARQELAAGSESDAFIDHLSERIDRRSRMLESTIEPDAFAALRRELELDRRLSQAWLSAVIQKARFSLSDYRLESISDEDRRELDFLAEALAKSWQSSPGLVMYIDGHADSTRFRGESECGSATKNRELSRLRAETVGELFRAKLGGDPTRVRLDWFGNFSPLQAAGEDFENRRIELRVTSEQLDGSPGSHRDYFAMREDLKLAGRSFARRGGRWVEAVCRDRPAAAEVFYLGDAWRDLVARLGLDETVRVRLGAGDERELLVGLGNAFVVLDGERCVEVVACEVASP